MEIKNNNFKNINYEEVLVVETKKLFKDGCFSGVKTKDITKLLDCIKQDKQFLPRHLMEEDPNYKQIIPYIVFYTDHKIFLMQRKNSTSEQRLKNKMSIGIGGHIRSIDTNSDFIINWAAREFKEEIDFDGAYSSKIIGIINDDSNDVGKVHLGIIIGMHSNDENIKIKSELKSGKLILKSEIYNYFEDMEEWSKLILNYFWPKN